MIMLNSKIFLCKSKMTETKGYNSINNRIISNNPNLIFKIYPKIISKKVIMIINIFDFCYAISYFYELNINCIDKILINW